MTDLSFPNGAGSGSRPSRVRRLILGLPEQHPFEGRAEIPCVEARVSDALHPCSLVIRTTGGRAAKSLRQSLEVDLPNVAEVILNEEDVTIAVHRNTSDLADFVAGRVKPLAVPGMGAVLSVHEDMHYVSWVHIQYLVALVQCEEIAIRWATSKCHARR